MRISLLASTLFTVSLIGSAALAEGPRLTDKGRSHGDTIDKSYAAATPRAGVGGVVGAAPTGAPSRQAKTVVDRGSSRINCSDTGADCHTSTATRVQTGGAQGFMQSDGGSTKRPGILDKVMGNDRTNFNEAGEDSGMSSRAAKRAWSGHGGQGHPSSSATGAAAKTGAHTGDSEKGDGGGSGRMSCNEADECSMANKDVKKIWASASAKAGTLPIAAHERAEAAAAARRAAALRRADSAAQAVQQQQLIRAQRAGGATGGGDAH